LCTYSEYSNPFSFHFIFYNNTTWSISQLANHSTRMRWHGIIVLPQIWFRNCWLSVGSFVIHTCKPQYWWPSILGYRKIHSHIYFSHPMTIPSLSIIFNFTIYFFVEQWLTWPPSSSPSFMDIFVFKVEFRSSKLLTSSMMKSPAWFE